MELKSIELAPIRERPEDYDAIEAEIIALFKREIYLPLLRELKVKSSALHNAMDDLITAILTGRIRFYRGYFRGQFSASLGRELKRLGARWDRTEAAFALPAVKLGPELRQAIELSETRFLDAAARVTRKLSEISPAEIAGKLKLEDLFSRALWRVQRGIEKTVRDITVAPKLTPEQAARVSAEYTKNMQLYIQDFTEKEISELRMRVADRAMKGLRYEGLVKEIQASYGVSHRKAKFLARQETSLMMTKFKQTRYESAGVREYKWACVKMPHQAKGAPYEDGEVRYYHGLNEGKTFRWDSPPIVNAKGERKNPGQDYGCRCFAIPVVRFGGS